MPNSALQTVSSRLNEPDELDYLSSATLTKRKDFLDREEEARGANRVLYYRRNADNDRLIGACSRKLEEEPHNVRALLLRAASYVKKGEHLEGIFGRRLRVYCLGARNFGRVWVLLSRCIFGDVWRV